MNKLTEAEFLDFYSKAYGELTDKLGQIAYHKFTGEELFEFVNDAIEYWAKNQRSGYDTEIKRDICDYYVSHPTLIDPIIVTIPPLDTRNTIDLDTSEQAKWYRFLKSHKVARYFK